MESISVGINQHSRPRRSINGFEFIDISDIFQTCFVFFFFGFIFPILCSRKLGQTASRKKWLYVPFNDGNSTLIVNCVNGRCFVKQITTERKHNNHEKWNENEIVSARTARRRHFPFRIWFRFYCFRASTLLFSLRRHKFPPKKLDWNSAQSSLTRYTFVKSIPLGQNPVNLDKTR